MTIAIMYHPECALHQMSDFHPECPERVMVIQESLKNYPFTVPIQFYDAPLCSRDDVIKAHDADYVDWIISISPNHQGLIQIDADTLMGPDTLNAAFRAAGGVLFAVDLVMQDQAKVAFCNVRPPGHHAEKDKAMGFCFFNNLAIGVLHAIEKFNIKRVTIIDFDLHHGNGTQHIFQNDERVLLCSSFQHPFYPGYQREMDNAHLLNVPLDAGTNGRVFREKVSKAWFDAIIQFQPELIFFSAGFDAHKDDPLGNLQLVKDDYVWLTKEIAGFAKQFCNGKMISVLEGGYHLPALSECVPAHVEAMV